MVEVKEDCGSDELGRGSSTHRVTLVKGKLQVELVVVVEVRVDRGKGREVKSNMVEVAV